MAKTRLQLTPHFTIEEFDCHDGTKVPKAAEDDIKRWCEWWGEPMRKRFGAVTILSGYRTAAHNKSVNGAARSVHLLSTELPGRTAGTTHLAVAGDVVAATGDVWAWHAWAQAHRKRHAHLAGKGRGGIGRYARQHFLHLDTAQLRDWSG